MKLTHYILPTDNIQFSHSYLLCSVIVSVGVGCGQMKMKGRSVA